MKPEIVAIEPVDNPGNVRALASVRFGVVVTHGWLIVQATGEMPSVKPPAENWKDLRNGRVMRGLLMVELPPDLMRETEAAIIAEMMNNHADLLLKIATGRREKSGYAQLAQEYDDEKRRADLESMGVEPARKAG